MINRRHLLGIVPLAATLLLAGCAADSQMEQGQTADGLRAIRLTATVGDGARADTRAAIDIQSEQFEQGETFYAHFPSGASVTNSTFETSDASGNTTCIGTQPYFNAGVNSVTVHAYYPQTVTEAANQTFSVALDQTGKANYKASDLMYATTTVTKSGLSATGELQFSHKMSKIIVNASCRQGVSKIKKVRIVNGFRTIDIVNPTTTAENTSPFFGETPSRTNAITTADDGCVKLYEDATGGASVNCAGLIPPQTIDGSFLQVVTSEGTATYSLASKTFASGESYTYSFTVSLASIGITTLITDWTAAGDATELVNNGGATLLSPRVLLSAITSESTGCKGYYVGQDGYAYKSIDAATSSGTSAVARITYVGSVPGYFDNFLAIALEDASSSIGNWATQMSAANTWASNHPVTVDGTTYSSCSTSAYDQVTEGGSTSKPKSSGAVKGWRVPSVTDWKYIFAGIGGKAVDNSAVTDGAVYSSGTDSGDSDDSHRALLNKWCGQAWNATTMPQAVQSDGYWSSSEYAEMTDIVCWLYFFKYSRFAYHAKTSKRLVRAVFAY